MSEESVSASAAQAPKQTPKQRSDLEELGFFLANLIKSKYNLPENVKFIIVHDEVLNADFELRKTKEKKIHVSLYKNQRRAPRAPPQAE